MKNAAALVTLTVLFAVAGAAVNAGVFWLGVLCWLASGPLWFWVHDRMDRADWFDADLNAAKTDARQYIGELGARYYVDED